MRILITAFMILLSTNSFAQVIDGYKAFCSVTAADWSSGRYMNASKTETFSQGSSYKIDFPSLLNESSSTLTIQTTTESSHLIYNVLISNLKRKDRVLSVKFDIDGDSISRNDDDYDRKEGLNHKISIDAISKNSIIHIRGTISNKNKTYLRLIDCRVRPLEIQ